MLQSSLLKELDSDCFLTNIINFKSASTKNINTKMRKIDNI